MLSSSRAKRPKLGISRQFERRKNNDSSTFRMPRQYLPKHNGPICFPTHGKQSRTKRQILHRSAATSREEIGNPPHYGTVNKLRQEGIPVLNTVPSR